jgi:hypothetical protein
MLFVFYSAPPIFPPTTTRDSKDTTTNNDRTLSHFIDPLPLSSSKRNMPPKTVPANARGSNSRTAEYTITECLLLCKAWISTSEDKVKGADQKKATFNDAFSKKYHYIKKVQEKKETLQKQRLAQARTRTLGHESEEDEEIRAISVKYPNRTVPSVLKKKGELWRITKKWLAF